MAGITGERFREGRYPIRISVASGKGGTGKTLISTSLALALSRRGRDTVYVDLDVEEPNGHLLLGPEITEESEMYTEVPAMKVDACSGSACAKCQDFCAFNAIVAIGNRVMVFDELCHACPGCVHVCPEEALYMKKRPIGHMRRGHVGDLKFMDGHLNVSEAMPTPLIRDVIKIIDRQAGEFQVVDSPPGTSCSVMLSVGRADMVLLVAEPTPFGIHDLELAIGMTRHLDMEPVVVVNRWNLGDRDTMEKFLDKHGVRAIGWIPVMREVAESYAQGSRPYEMVPQFTEIIDEILDTILGEVEP